jgi:hypothetical protein
MKKWSKFRLEKRSEVIRIPTRSWSLGRRRDEKNYDDFLILCKKIEKMMNKSVEDLTKRTTEKESFNETKKKFKSKSFKFGEIIHKIIDSSSSLGVSSERLSQGHYVWMQPDMQRYRSR